LFGVATRFACGSQALRGHVLIKSLPTRFRCSFAAANDDE
jgi:hypothetical protein